MLAFVPQTVSPCCNFPPETRVDHVSCHVSPLMPTNCHIIFQAVACPAVRRERRHQPGPAVSCQTGYLSLALTRAQADREGRVSDWVVETLETVMSSGDTSQ